MAVGCDNFINCLFLVVYVFRYFQMGISFPLQAGYLNFSKQVVGEIDKANHTLNPLLADHLQGHPVHAVFHKPKHMFYPASDFRLFPVGLFLSIG